jgi:hypothetical protein
VFCKEITQVRQFSEDLVQLGVPVDRVGYFHSPNKNVKPAEQKRLLKNEELFRKNTIRVLFSTCALGLGYDKNDIRHVVHLWTPNSMVQYYQELGRAGRFQGDGLATAHMLPSNVWNPSGWAAVLSNLCWFLRRRGDCSASMPEIDARAQQLRVKESDVKRAIELGAQKKLLVVEDSTVRLVNPNTATTAVDKLYGEQMQEEVQLMDRLAHNGGADHLCIWRFMLDQFEGRHNGLVNCDKCSGQQCSPGGDILAEENVASAGKFYGLTTVNGLAVFALNRQGDELDANEERLKTIFGTHRPSMVLGQL